MKVRDFLCVVVKKLVSPCGSYFSCRATPYRSSALAVIRSRHLLQQSKNFLIISYTALQAYKKAFCKASGALLVVFSVFVCVMIIESIIHATKNPYTLHGLHRWTRSDVTTDFNI